MRSKYAAINGIMAVAIFVVNGIISFVLRKVMLPVLGGEIVGLTATFADILAFLNLADMGLSSSVGAGLYKPIHNNDYSRIKGILRLFKRLYCVCGCFFSAAAVVVAIVMRFAFSSPGLSGRDASVYFLLTAASTGLTYFISYRLIILSTDQRMFRLKLLNSLFRIVSAVIKIYVLLIFRSFALFLVTDIVFTFLYLAAMNLLIKAAYRKVERAVPVLLTEDKSGITKMIKGLLFHRVAEFAVFGTNNLYTAIFSGLTSAALLSNYQMVIAVMSGAVSNAFSGITSSIGSLIASSGPHQRYKVFRAVFFADCCVVITGTVTFLNCAQAFIGAWYGDKYIAGKSIVYILAANFFITAVRPATEQFKNAAGIFYEDRYVPIAEAIINAIACIILGRLYGMAGVAAGNVISTLLVVAWQKPYMTFKYVFKIKLRYYFADLFKYVLAGAACFGLSAYLCSLVKTHNLWAVFFAGAGISVAVCAAVLGLLFHRSAQLKQLAGYVAAVKGSKADKAKTGE